MVVWSLLLFSCGVKTPEERGIEVSDVYKIYNQDKAMFTLQFTVEDYYDVDLGNLALGGTTVYWVDTKCPYTDDNAVISDGVCYHGVMWGCNEMYVAMVNNRDTTCGTALLHEFGHCLRRSMGMDTSDGDHWDEEFWNIVIDVQEHSCGRNWISLEDRDKQLRHMEKMHL